MITIEEHNLGLEEFVQSSFYKIVLEEMHALLAAKEMSLLKYDLVNGTDRELVLRKSRLEGANEFFAACHKHFEFLKKRLHKKDDE